MKYVFDITDSEGIQNGLKEMLRNAIRNAHYFEGHPEQGGIRVPRNKSIAFIELIKAMEEATGRTYVPTDDAEQMKVVRQKSYSKQLEELIERRKWNSDLETSNEEIKKFRRIWLEKEKENIQRWKTEAPNDRPEITIELDKYEEYINEMTMKVEEIEAIGTFDHCTAEKFKTDISELCPECPLPAHILQTMDRQIVFQTKQQREVLTDSQFAEYCNAEIQSAQKEMMETSLLVQRDKDDAKFRNNRILHYIWNKERIKAINKILFPNSPKIKDQQKLTVREKMLIHCYEQREVINKGEPNYNDYIIFATPTKRKAYPNGSVNKAKSLLASINKILPYLSEKAAQQAKSEIATIEANI